MDTRLGLGRFLRTACVWIGCVVVGCNGDGDGGGARPVPLVQASVASMDAIGDSISKGFDAADEGDFCQGEQESRNFATGDTHGDDLCSDGGEGVFSHAERLECVQQTQIVRADPNAAVSGARMLTDFAAESATAASFLVAQPAPRYVTILMGHNDVCGGTIDRVQASCPHGADEDPQNHCRTTPQAFERELRRGLDALVVVPSLRIGVAAPVRVSLLCTHGSRDLCAPGGIFGEITSSVNCDDFWEAAIATNVPDERGICGSLTEDCSEERIINAYQISKAYRDITSRVAAEYAEIAEGSATPGGAVKAAGVEVVYSDAAWRTSFDDRDISCCDCFHPSVSGQDRLSRGLMEGITCGNTDVCCGETGDPLVDGRCAAEDRSGTFVPGFFPLVGS